MEQGPGSQEHGWSTVPRFGEQVVGVTYTPRPSVYAIIPDPDGRVALCRVRAQYFLPGGGVESGENPSQAMRREVREETGLVVQANFTVARALEHVHAAREGYVVKQSTFYLAQIISVGPGGEPDHELRWCRPTEVELAWGHGSHAWAVKQVTDRLRT